MSKEAGSTVLPLKLVVMSATMAIEDFSQLFPTAPVVQVSTVYVFTCLLLAIWPAYIHIYKYRIGALFVFVSLQY
jgi:hypothetical protein